MAGTIGEVPPHVVGPTGGPQTDPRGWARRHWLSVLLGAIPGVFLGLRTAQMVTEGGMSDLAPVFDLLLIAPTGVVLLTVAAIAKRSGPAIAAISLVGSWLLAWYAGTFVWH